MIRLTIVTALLAVAVIVVRRRARNGPGGDSLRVTSRTGITRGVLAAVLEVEDRRFLVTISAGSTTLVAELGASTVPAPSPAATPATEPAIAAARAAEAPVAADDLPADASFLDRIRARTLRTYDPALASHAGH